MSDRTEKISKNIHWLVKKSVQKNHKKYFLHNPFFNKIEKNYLNNCIDSTFVSTAGKYIPLFENSLKKIIKSKNIIAVVNGTVALKICLEVLGVKRGYEVLVPSLTFVGTVNSIKHAGAIPHFVDSDIENFGIDNKKLEKYLKSSTIKKNGILINRRTKRRIFAIIPVHIFGNIGEIIELKKICRNYNLKIIEDAAEALGSFFQNKHAGNFGDLGILSFNANKTITTGSGGAIICNSNKLAKKIRHLISVAKIEHPWDFLHDDIGWNYKMSNLSAAVGYAQMKKFKKIILLKKKLSNNYRQNCKNIDGFTFCESPKKCQSNNWLNVIKIKDISIQERNQILNYVNKKSINCRPVWRLISSLKMYSNLPKADLSNALKLEKSLICLPSSAEYGL